MWKYLFGLFAVCGGLLMFAAETGPSQATSNIKAWIEFLGVTEPLPAWLIPYINDSFVFWGGVVVIVLSFLSFYFVWKEKKLQTQKINGDDFKEKLVPKIKILFDEKEYFSLERTAAEKIYSTMVEPNKGMRTFWVRLETVSSEAIPDCKVNILSIVNTKTGESHVNFVDSLMRRITDSESFPLRSGDPEDVNVVRYSENEKDASISICYWREKWKDFSIPKGKYKIRLSAVGSNTVAAVMECLVWVGDDGRLQMISVEE